MRLVGTKSYRNGFGATVRVITGSITRTANVRSGSSYLSASDLRPHFGLGAAKQADRVIVRWPSGLEEERRPLAADQVVELKEGSGKIYDRYFWCEARDVENGPYNIQWMAFRTWEQFLELMALIQSMGDQVHLITMNEPAGIQFQDFLRQPFKHHRVTEKSQFEGGIRAVAYWQMRMCDLPGCLARTRLRGEEVRFNLHLTDTIGRFLEEDAPWKGVGGDYVVALGPSSGAEPGTDPALSTLTASVGAFTRMWLGVRPATGLAVTDALSGPPELLERLDWALRLPDPKPDWDF